MLITLHDILKAYDNRLQTDIVILDFSKAFDTVPHDRLLTKLQHMGITSTTNAWIKGFLTNRSQKVVVDGVSSTAADVVSGVPQGSVLGPLLFLCHINDLPNRVKSQVRMFTDDCLLYRQIKSEEDHNILQNDLAELEQWAQMWGMSFNPIKCYVMTVGRGRKLSTRIYDLCDHPLEQVDKNPYLGVLLSQDKKWAPHINKICKKANGTLGFLRRNLRTCPTKLKETAYISLVRSTLEYSCTIWDPHLKKDIKAIEAVQRRAARFVCGDFDRQSSVTEMLGSLGWQSLENRRREARLVMLFKVVHGLVAVPLEGHVEKSVSRTRAKNSERLKVYAPATDIFKTSFIPKTIKDWNNLPDSAVQSATVDIFKNEIKNCFD